MLLWVLRLDLIVLNPVLVRGPCRSPVAMATWFTLVFAVAYACLSILLTTVLGQAGYLNEGTAVWTLWVFEMFGMIRANTALASILYPAGGKVFFTTPPSRP